MPCPPDRAGEAEPETSESRPVGEQGPSLTSGEDHVASQALQRRREGAHPEEKGGEHL